MTPVMNGNFQSPVRPRHLLLYGLNAYLFMEDREEVRHLDDALVMQAFFCKMLIELPAQGRIAAYKVVRLF